jgi:hypothetical protein
MKRVTFLWIAITIAVAGCKTKPTFTPDPDSKDKVRQDSILLPGWDGLDLETMTLAGPTPLPEFLTKVTGLAAPQIATLTFGADKGNDDIMYGISGPTREIFFRNGAKGALLPVNMNPYSVKKEDVTQISLSGKTIPINYTNGLPNIIVETREGGTYIVPIIKFMDFKERNLPAVNLEIAPKKL